jgi:hypothetical protein
MYEEAEWLVILIVGQFLTGDDASDRCVLQHGARDLERRWPVSVISIGTASTNAMAEAHSL